MLAGDRINRRFNWESSLATVLETNLVRTPGVCGGRLRIDGTRMTVNQIVTLHKQGLSAEDIVGEYPHRMPGEIYTVLAWYYARIEEFDQELAAEAEEEKRLAQEHERFKKSCARSGSMLTKLPSNTM